MMWGRASVKDFHRTFFQADVGSFDCAGGSDRWWRGRESASQTPIPRVLTSV
jgi:hypothetical protein